MTQSEILSNLNVWHKNSTSRWGIFYSGKPIFLSTVKLYKTAGIAKGMLVTKLRRYTTSAEHAETLESVNYLLKAGIIEIREVK